MRKRLLGAALLLLNAGSASAADWPCVQRKVPEISLAAVWTGPPLDSNARNWRADPAVAALVSLLAARRTPEDEARKAIAGFAQSAGAAKGAKLLALISGLVETVNIERGEVIAGLERFGGAQKQMAILLRDENAKLSDLRSAATADQARITDLTEQLVWSLRIFDERQKSLRFVCEVPVLIEQQLFALAKEIQKTLQ